MVLRQPSCHHAAARTRHARIRTRAAPPAKLGVTLVETSGRRTTTYQLGEHVHAAAASSSRPAAPPESPLDRLRDALRALYLPAGYPGSVTDDYLAYQLATVPAHITGWLSISLTTSSLLKAVGINAGTVGVTAAAAAIKWIVKDGVGSAGRLLVGSRLGQEFDDDPRRWRMMAEALTTAGLAMEIATAVYPAQFLLLASLGNFSKAVGKGMGKPVFRVVQTHFAAAGNVGAVAAKEEVWEMSAQLTGYALSVALLQQLQGAGSWHTVVGLWALVQGVHVGARFLALRQLRFRYLNRKRALMLVNASVAGTPLPSVAEANAAEPMLQPAAALSPAVALGVSVEQAWGAAGLQALPPGQLQAWLQLHAREGHLLVWRDGGAHVVLKEGSQRHVLLRAMWQAAWLARQQQGLAGGAGRQQPPSLQLWADSLAALEAGFEQFLAEAAGLGWDVDSVRVKTGEVRLSVLGAA